MPHRLRCYGQRKDVRIGVESKNAEIRNLYKNVNDNDNEALKVQMQLRDKINSLTGDNE